MYVFNQLCSFKHIGNLHICNNYPFQYWDTFLLLVWVWLDGFIDIKKSLWWSEDYGQSLYYSNPHMSFWSCRKWQILSRINMKIHPSTESISYVALNILRIYKPTFFLRTYWIICISSNILPIHKQTVILWRHLPVV